MIINKCCTNLNAHKNQPFLKAKYILWYHTNYQHPNASIRIIQYCMFYNCVTNNTTLKIQIPSIC